MLIKITGEARRFAVLHCIIFRAYDEPARCSYGEELLLSNALGKKRFHARLTSARHLRFSLERIKVSRGKIKLWSCWFGQGVGGVGVSDAHCSGLMDCASDQ